MAVGDLGSGIVEGACGDSGPRLRRPLARAARRRPRARGVPRAARGRPQRRADARRLRGRRPAGRRGAADDAALTPARGSTPPGEPRGGLRPRRDGDPGVRSERPMTEAQGTTGATGDDTTAPGYARIRALLAGQAAGRPRRRRRHRAAARRRGRAAGADERLWGTRSLIDTPDLVLDVHRRYVATGCDVISTNTWGLASALAADGPRLWDDAGAPVHWMDIARRGLRLAHDGRVRGRRPRTASPPAVAFSLNADVDSPDGRETIRLLARLFADEPTPPDLVLVETLSASCGRRCYETVEELLADRPAGVAVASAAAATACAASTASTGAGRRATSSAAPRGASSRWASARCSSTASRPTTSTGMVSYLRDFTDLPLGVYPNLGYFTDARLALRPRRRRRRVRADGARLARGGGADRRRLLRHAARAHRRRARAPRRHEAGPPPPRRPRRPRAGGNGRVAGRAAAAVGRRPRPPPVPAAVPRPRGRPRRASRRTRRASWSGATSSARASAPTSAASTSAAAPGILGVQLALNGASHVRAIDVDRRAVANTLTNAFRNGVDDRLTATVVDLFPWVPEERYEVVVASLLPAARRPRRRGVDPPRGRLLGPPARRPAHRQAAPMRSRPRASRTSCSSRSLSQQRTAELLDAAGLPRRGRRLGDVRRCRPTPPRRATQIERVEQLSDAYHLQVGERDVVVAYLLEITAKANGNGRRARGTESAASAMSARRAPARARGRPRRRRPARRRRPGRARSSTARRPRRAARSGSTAAC